MSSLVRVLLLLAAAAAALTVVSGLNLTGVITSPRTLLEGEKLYLFCQAEGHFLACGWDSPLEGIIYPGDLDPEGDIAPLPGFNCGIVVHNVSLRHAGHWTCIATTDHDFQAAGGDVTVKPYSSWPGIVANVSSPLSGAWGLWGNPDLCPPNSFADSVELKSEAPVTWDNTAANGVLFQCRHQGGALASSVSSTVGDFGTWRGGRACPVPEYVERFRLRVEPENSFDEVAATDIMFTCSHYPEDILTGGGETWGNWGDWASCPPDTAVCGVQTKVEPYQGVSDDTSLNDVRVFCCPTVW
ncbi:vitelline membrane outer layer protein 1-like [Panulirus ornatus]|uniref:vitelline membrane outer layer protein 1-like n=1 Tax=Panulirus ornatus TaxID=150431 RepID=UPI003A88AC1E